MTNYNWWEDKIPEKKWEDTFRGWVGDENAASRLHLKKYLTEMKGQVNSILECGCAFSVDSGWIPKLGIKYSAIDFTQVFVDDCAGRGLDVAQSSIEDIKKADEEYDIVYCRHVLEHLSYYEKALKEMIRVAKKEVIVIFFIPLQEVEQIIFNEEMKLNHNRYALDRLMNFLKDYKVEYKMIDGINESILHIYK
jgi:2-polyprenyl-3-methyl-5-hydroxy-6-metoxy-1,4-benzoquinol methylase